METIEACKLLDCKIDSLHFLCRELNLKIGDLLNYGRHEKELANKRWVVMYFYRLAGKSFPEIGKITNHNHTSVLYACKNIDDTTKAIAEELYIKYVTEIMKKPISSINYSKFSKRRMVLKKIPDYKHSKVILKEVLV